jgi:hypothetical protein
VRHRGRPTARRCCQAIVCTRRRRRATTELAGPPTGTTLTDCRKLVATLGRATFAGAPFVGHAPKLRLRHIVRAVAISDPLGFFDRQATRAFIDEFARSTHVTLFVGAGASIDRGSPDWGTIAGRLYSEMSDLPADGEFTTAVLRMIFATGDPAHLGSVVREQFRLRYPQPLAEHHLSNKIFQELYDGWLPRESMSTMVARLALFMANNGTRVHILTTNYDDNIESFGVDPTADGGGERMQLNELGRWAEANGLRLKSFTIAPPKNLRRRTIPVVHLNGLVGQSGNRDGQIVFSEEDFALFGEHAADPTAQAAYLEERFRSTSTLFVGTSLRDVHVVRALVRSRMGEDRRYAVMPAQQFNTPGADERVIDQLLDVLTLRLRHLGVQTVTPDFFGQVSQLLNELAHSCADPDGYIEVEYHKRLRRWWESWNRYTGGGSFDERQRYHQKRLASCIDLMRREGLLSNQVQTRIEIWIRSDPDDRHLELWSNSETVTVRHGTGHVARIGLNSTYPDPVGTFTNRQVTSGRPERTASRWQWQISSPVVLSGEWLEMPVGVVRVLLREPGDREIGSLSEASIATRAVEAARELLTP